MVSDQQPNNPLPLTAEIFRRALEQNAAIHQRSLADMQRHTDEVHDQLKRVTTQRIQAMQLVDFHYVYRAASLSPDFWENTVGAAKDVLRQHGELPPEDADDGTTDQTTSQTS